MSENNGEAGTPDGRPRLLITCLDDVPDEPAREFPKAEKRGKRLFVEVSEGREYEVPAGPLSVLYLVRHLSTKLWADRDFLHDLVERSAEACGWELGKYNR